MKHVEPPSPEPSTRIPLFMIGKDSRGNWVVQDQQGICGGLFVNRAEALKFAMFENGNRPQAVIMVPGVFEPCGCYERRRGGRPFVQCGRDRVAASRLASAAWGRHRLPACGGRSRELEWLGPRERECPASAGSHRSAGPWVAGARRTDYRISTCPGYLHRRPYTS